MTLRRSLQLVALLAFSSISPRLMTAQVVSYANANFGLIPNELQYLRVRDPVPSLFYQFFYDISGPFDLVTIPLKAGFAYNVQISGRHGVGPLDRGVAMGDPAYYPAFNDIDLVHYPIYPGAPGSETWVTGWDGVNNRRPSVDGYQPTHVYDYFIQGRGAGLSFTFRDYPYGDNVGGATVAIFELGALEDPSTVPEPATATLLGAGLIGIAAIVRRRRSAQSDAEPFVRSASR